MSRSSLSVWASDVTPKGFTVHGGIQLGSSTWNGYGFNCYTSVDGVGSNNHNVVIPEKGGYREISNSYGVAASWNNRTFTCKCGGDFNWSSQDARPSINPVSITVTVPAGLHSVSYDANGGSGAPGGQTKEWGHILTLSQTRPTRAGYTFKGWATSRNGNVAYHPGGQYGADENVTLYAVWQINTYTVTFKDGYSGATLKTQSVNYGGSASAPSVSRTGYTHTGWDRSFSNVTSNITVNATWRINQYNLDVNMNLDGTQHNNGLQNVGTFDVYIDGALDTNDAYNFWRELNYGTKYSVQDIRAKTGYTYTGSSGALSGSIPAYAVGITLNFKTKKYTLSFNQNTSDQVTNMPSSMTKTHFQSLKLPTNIPERRRYEFLGWATSSGGNVVYRAGDTYSTEGDATLYAVWKLKASIIGVYNAEGAATSGICSIYDDDGNHHYAILWVYDSNGNRREVI